jgi:hypothetical protein
MKPSNEVTVSDFSVPEEQKVSSFMSTYVNQGLQTSISNGFMVYITTSKM